MLILPNILFQKKAAIKITFSKTILCLYLSVMKGTVLQHKTDYHWTDVQNYLIGEAQPRAPSTVQTIESSPIRTKAYQAMYVCFVHADFVCHNAG